MTAAENRIHALFEELVPASGKADTVAGEIIRAVSRIAYRNYNDGDHVGVGYGNETCNPAARYLGEVAGSHVQQAVLDMWECGTTTATTSWLRPLRRRCFPTSTNTRS